MKYYCIMTHTPYVGENSYHYFAAESEDDEALIEFANECVFDNAQEWYSEDEDEEMDSLNFLDWEEYINECGYTVGEVSYEEYIQFND